MVMWWLYPSTCARAFINSLSKCGPPSLIIQHGSPRWTAHLRTARAATTDVVTAAGTNSTSLLNLSTSISTYVYPERLRPILI